MSDKTTPPVSVRKDDPAASAPQTGRAGRLATLVKRGANPPKLTRIGVSAFGVAALAALITALDLYGLKGWLFIQARKSNPDPGKSGHRTAAELHDHVNSTISGQLVATLVVVLAIGLVARACWIGRYWARWAAIGLWVLATLTNTFAGFFYVVTVGTSEPLAFKVPAFIAAVAFTVGMILVNLRPSVDYLNLTRPAGSARPARRGMFGGGLREQVRQAESLPGASPIRGRSGGSGRPAGGRGPARTARTRTEHPRGKQRAGADVSSSDATASADGAAKSGSAVKVDSATRGAELARARAKAASKSRRNGA